LIRIKGVGINGKYLLSGAVQCGFCTPGIILAAKALLDVNPAPSVEEIKTALRRNLCRCTGYKKIIEAVQLVARFLRGETTPEAYRPDPNGSKLGISHPRPSALAKACGTAHFTADVKLEGALELAVLRSTVPHARIVAIDASRAITMPGVAGVLTAADIQGTNTLKLQVPDRPVFCRDKVRCIGDPILAVAAETRAQAEAALKRNTFDMKTLIVQTPRSTGPIGATGVGEMCLVPTAAAVINAIKNAVGIWVLDLPATPDKIRAALAAPGADSPFG